MRSTAAVFGAVLEDLIKEICRAQGTFYGQQDGQDAQGTCSYNENFANTVKLPWSTGVDNTIALNDAQFANSGGCGLCIKYRGTGAGLGTTPLSTTEWKTAFVNNRCVQCMQAALPLAQDAPLIPCNYHAQLYACPAALGNNAYQSVHMHFDLSRPLLMTIVE